MITENFPLVEYLARIGLKESPKISSEGLQELHAAQAFSIPFENLDILLGRTLSLAPEDLYAKLIHQRRGGYCFELNGLLCLALKSLGFTVQPLLARVLYGLPNPSAHTHEVLIVTIEGNEWLADVGFGGPGLCLPVPIIADQVTEQYGESYRLKRDPDYGMILQKVDRENSYFDLYCFHAKERTLDVDIEMANHYTSTWPGSIFRLLRMCALRQPWGRVTLSDMDLTIYRGGQSTRTVLPPGPEYLAALSEHLGIQLDARYEDLVRYQDVKTKPS
jgi:N-hydroxyarylamine O-acetyltransferase